MAKQYSKYYRPDIDGLRAVAVLSVILFHANLGFPGGFVGVDIFFVISGYLIFSIIQKELDGGTFSLIKFWERRVRRIVPALVTVVLATFVAGWFYFLPEDLVRLGKSVIAQAALLSNFFFYGQWRDGNSYFAPTLDPKPLLHTWSLAVEEQFYLLFPVLLVLMAKSQRLSSAKTLAAILLGSLLLSVMGIGYYPWATFYLLPARAWELLLGALIAITRGRIRPNQRTNEIAGGLGLILVGYAVFSYNKYDPFPGAAAIPPCLGAALIIFSSEMKLSFVGRILALKPVVFFGLISYSLYLWHWPLLEFSKYPNGYQSNSDSVNVVILLTSVVLAILTWKYVERPFRERWIFPRRSQIFWSASILMATLILSGFFVIKSQGFPSRYSGRAFSYVVTRDHVAFENSLSLDQAVAGHFQGLGAQGTNQPIKLLIWGDSHAMAVTPVLDELCRRYSWRGIQATHSSTAPVLRYVSKQGEALNENSPAFNQAVLDYIGKKHVRNVVISAYWTYYPATDEFKADLLSTVRAVMKLGAKVYVLKDVPKQAPNLATKIACAILNHSDLSQLGITPKAHRDANHAWDQVFEQISQMGATVLDPADYFLNDKGLYGVVKNNQVLYWDSSHLTVEGSRLLAPLFEPIFKSN